MKMDLWPSEWRPCRPAMLCWLGWRWEFDWSSNTRAGKGGWGGGWFLESSGLFWRGWGYDCGGQNGLRANDWGVVCGLFGCGRGNDCFGGGGRRTGWKYEEERKGIVLEDKKKKRKKFI